MTATLTAATAVLLLASGARAEKAPAAAEAAAEPTITMSVPAACADVWKQVYEGADDSWKVTVLPPRPADEKIPDMQALGAFVASVEGLESALAGYDAADRDIFYVRTRTKSLKELGAKYPKLDKGILRAAKVQACRDVAGE